MCFTGITDSDNLGKDDKLDENCLNLYILSEHVKKRSRDFICVNSKFPWILEADCLLVKYWEYYMLCIVFYICILYPYFIGIKRYFPGGVIFYIEIIIMISLIFNVIMNLVTAVKTKKKYLKDFNSILNYRMNTLGFYLDLIAIIPFEYIVRIQKKVSYLDNFGNHLFYFCKGIKLSVIWRLSSFFEKQERKLLSNSILIKVHNFIIEVIYLASGSLPSIFTVLIRALF